MLFNIKVADQRDANDDGGEKATGFYVAGFTKVKHRSQCAYKGKQIHKPRRLQIKHQQVHQGKKTEIGHGGQQHGVDQVSTAIVAAFRLESTAAGHILLPEFFHASAQVTHIQQTLAGCGKNGFVFGFNG